MLLYTYRFHGANYISHQPVVSPWLVNQFPLRVPTFTWDRSRIIARTTSYDEFWLHTAESKPGYHRIYTTDLPIINNTLQTIPVSVQQNNAKVMHSVRINHYPSLYKNRDDQYIQLEQQTMQQYSQQKTKMTTPDRVILVKDGKPMLFMMHCIDDYKNNNMGR